MSDKDLNPDDFNADDMHFSEEELEAAMAGFEREFNEAEAAKQRESQAEKTDDDSDAADVLNAAQSSLQFEDELQGLLGNRAKTAVIITRRNCLPPSARFLTSPRNASAPSKAPSPYCAIWMATVPRRPPGTSPRWWPVCQ